MQHCTKTPLIYLGMLASFPLLTFDLFQPALPTMTDYFNTNQSLGQLTLSINLFFYGFAQLLWGPLIDHYGRRKILPISLFCFIFSTILCIVSQNIYMLLIGRALQGFFACCANVLAFSSTRDIHDSKQRARTLSQIAMLLALSPMLGPIIGGFVFVYSNWQMTFILMIFFALILYIVGTQVIHESPNFRTKKNPINFVSTFKKYAIVLKLPLVRHSMLMQSASFSCIMVVVVNISYLLIDDLGIKPEYFGYFFAFNGLTIIVGNSLGIKLRNIYSIIWNIRFGSIVMTTGGILLLGSSFLNGLSIITLSFILIINIGCSLLNPPAISLALNRMPQLSGTITGIINTCRSSISSLIASLVGSFVALHFMVLPIALMVLSIICLIAAFCLYRPGSDLP
ncbi:Bcr/CflA family efflux MFS transporter [Legionella sp. W05-934-2]|uniref:Bcr/CflA family efflux MFS transporter n=1 Tax=Legionella sp. W05-934-2 TaxID=1198649 RepID=UPI0034635F9D